LTAEAGVRVQEEDLMSRIMIILVSALALHVSSVLGTESISPTVNCRGTGMTFEGWENWEKVTPRPVRSKGHSNNWVGIYVNELAKETYLSSGSPYQVCAKIVKPVYTDSRGKVVIKLTIMVKMAPGYDPENANWWYGVYGASGTDMWDEGKLPDCIICHKQATETDYLFSKEVTGAAEE